MATSLKDIITGSKLNEFFVGLKSIFQNKLTAGTNIAINGDTISATNTVALNYTTSEQVIGTWVDGKTLYQKVVTGLKTAKTTQTQEAILNISGWNIDTLITLKGLFKNTSNASRIIEGDFKQASGTTSIYPYLFSTGSNGEIQNVITIDTETNRDLTLVLCYTKTTD